MTGSPLGNDHDTCNAAHKRESPNARLARLAAETREMVEQYPFLRWTSSASKRITVAQVHVLTGADVDGLRQLPGYDSETDTLDFDISRVLDVKPGPPQPPMGLDVRHG